MNILKQSLYLSKIISEFEKPKSGKTLKSKKKVEDDVEETEKSGQYVKIHETSKNDAMLILTKRRAAILKENIEKIIQKNGEIIDIEYKSRYTGENEILKFNIKDIEFKQHGNNQSNSIISSSQINKIAHTIQHSKDILIEGINKHYSDILRDFINFNDKTKLSTISKFIGLIDICHCKAYNADKFNYSKPLIQENSIEKEKSFVKFKKMRHCLIEHINTKELYVTNDLELGENTNGLLLYGTNAVGKTSFIKSIGISIILAQAGMFVPCEEFTYYPYQYLFTRILGNDNIFKGLSTFAVEMCELRTILKYSTKNSIILGDELCSGTESTSALSIFVSSLERLHDIESTFLFATHFHEILEYEEIKQLEKIKTCHMSVIFDREKNKLIYDRKLKNGPGQAMYGLEVCKSLDMPDDFIDRAYTIRDKYIKNNDRVLTQKKTRYNSKKLRGMCELCHVNKGTEIHHLQFQKNSDEKGFIDKSFRKNHKANLVNICEECHNKIHNSDTQHKISKTSVGYEIMELV